MGWYNNLAPGHLRFQEGGEAQGIPLFFAPYHHLESGDGRGTRLSVQPLPRQFLTLTTENTVNLYFIDKRLRCLDLDSPNFLPPVGKIIK